MNILVLCTGNSVRSILLESIFNTEGLGRVRAFSAGSHPEGTVHGGTEKLLDAKDHDISQVRSKSWDEFAADDAPIMDIVITVCGNAANETCPIWPGTPMRAHWDMEDPAAAAPEDQDAAFAAAFEILEKRAKALLDQPIESMDAGALQAQLNRIGRMT